MTESILAFAILAVPVLLAVTVHEFAHGWVADRLGDPTARLAGRLTINPLKHLDPIGTIAFFVTQMVGWARPVPINAANFRHPRQGIFWVSLAGPAANLLLAAVFALMTRLLLAIPSGPTYLLLPMILICRAGVMVNLGLAFFNALPVPPLDGAGILSGLIPGPLMERYHESPYGFIILLALILTGVVDKIMAPLIRASARFLIGGF